MLASQGGILVPSYTVGKTAILGMTHEPENEWAAHRINVNGIAPGYMVTDNTEKLRQEKNLYESTIDRSRV
jgi:2-deoxy-D-gluconate 3-dehydrogenase